MSNYGLRQVQVSGTKRQQEAKAKQKIIQVKEVKFRPATDEGDYQVKLRNLKRFIEDGDKAKVTLRFRGREMAHQELGMRVLERVRDDMAELVQVEAMPKLEGRQMVMVLAPKRRLYPPARPTINKHGLPIRFRRQCGM